LGGKLEQDKTLVSLSIFQRTYGQRPFNSTKKFGVQVNFNNSFKKVQQRIVGQIEFEIST